MSPLLRQIKLIFLALLLPFFIGASSVESALKSLEHLSKTGSGAECTPSPSPAVTPTSEQPLKYDCKLIPIEGTPPIIPAKNPKHQGDEISIFEDNDNTLLMFMEYGNDEGFTHGLGATYLKHLDQKNPEKNRNLTFSLGSNLYTERKDIKVKSGTKHPENFIDVSQFKTSFRQGKSFYFVLGLGIEDRQTSPTKKNHLTPEAAVQEKWHELFDLDLNRYDPADDSAAKRFSRTSVLMSAAGGKKTVFYEGHCELNLEAGVSISTEDRKLLGQNSYGSIDAGLKTDFLKTKKGMNRFTAGVDGTMVYFPTDASDVGNLGARARVSLGSNFMVGKKKGTLQPFLTFTVPVGRQVFSPMNDNDVIQRVGLRFIFGQ